MSDSDRLEPPSRSSGVMDAVDIVTERGDGSSGHKRRRVAMACTACRGRKSRCDGRTPKCSTCTALGFECIYSAKSQSSTSNEIRECLAAMNARLAALEAAMSAHKHADYTYPTASSASSLDADQERRTRQIQFDESNPDDWNGTTAVSVNPDASGDSSDLQDPNDGMEAIIFTDEENCGFFGPSSSVAFTRHISRAVARVSHMQHYTASPASNGLPLDGSIMSVSRPGTPPARGGPRSNTTVNIHALPSDEVSLSLIKKYFSSTNLLFPYVHEATFLERYEEMKRNNFSKVSRNFLGLLNMVFAVASSSQPYDHPADMRSEESEVYYRRALCLCDMHITRSTSLESVQHHLLMTQYLQGTQKSIKAWSVHGLAVKMAFQLGLHSSEASKEFSTLEREVRKRTWFGCVVLDRTLSMTFGRPAAIPDDYVKLELPVDYEPDPSSPAPDADRARHNSVLFFNATIRLYTIMWKTIQSLYNGNIGCDSSVNGFVTVGHIYQMEHQLLEWECTLPPHMGLRVAREIPTEDGADMCERFRVLLTLRYHNLRILIHRPVLVKYLDVAASPTVPPQEAVLLQQIGSSSTQRCVESSMEIISIVNKIVYSPEKKAKYLGHWFWSLYFSFHAALVIFACLLTYQETNVVRPALLVTPETLRSYLDKAVGALSNLDNGNRMVERCCKYLGRMAQVIDLLSTNSLDPTATQYQSNLTPGSLPSQPAHPSIPRAVHQAGTGHSPVGMALGEFMADSDWNFLNSFQMPLDTADGRLQVQAYENLPLME